MKDRIKIDTEDGDRISYTDWFVSEERNQIVELLENEDFWNELSIKPIDARKAYEAIKKREIYPFISVCDHVIDVFEEPVADCFMIKIGGLDLKKYLKMVFNESWNTWKNRRNMGTDETFLEYMSSDVLRYRILSVCYAMIKDNPEEAQALNKSGYFLNIFTSRGRNIIKARRMFKTLHEKQERAIKNNFTQILLNPQEIVSDYLYKNVFTNERYQFDFTRVVDNNDIPIETYIQKIRKLMKNSIVDLLLVK